MRLFGTRGRPFPSGNLPTPWTKNLRLAFFAALLLGSSAVLHSTDLVAFPGAEGYGRLAKGGRGGDVYHVTSLADSGKGSLREGLKTMRGPRTIVFDVSGTIELEKDLRVEDKSGLTIAGQTAPGEGITLKNQPLQFFNVSDVIVRYIRVRLGDERKGSADCIDLGETKKPARNVIFDHVTATWGVDGTMDVYCASNFTMQWCLFGEALHNSIHEKGPHAMLMSIRKTQGNVSLHHNLLFSSRDRHPTLGGGPEPFNPKAIFDFRNNVIYNWTGPCNLGHGQFNLINNLWCPGPNTDLQTRPIAPKTEKPDCTVGFLSGNVVQGNQGWTRDNYSAVQWGTRGGKYSADVPRDKFQQSEQPVAMADRAATQTAEAGYEAVLAKAGASKARDAADLRIVRGIRERTHRRIDSPKEVGGWPVLRSLPAPVDMDGDGIPDEWERRRGLDPHETSDGNATQLSLDGYPNLEMYLNELAGDPVRWKQTKRSRQASDQEVQPQMDASRGE
jgi:hypothetical protein